MALDNYANLRQSIKKWSHREDIDEFSADCITMAEQELFYGQSPMRLPEMITETIAAHSTKEIAYPADMLELISLDVEYDEQYYRLKALPQNLIPKSDETGAPSHYAMGSQFILDVTPDKAYNFKIDYYAKPSALSDENPTNIILQKYPTAYLFGALSAAFVYAGEEEKSNQYALRMRDVVNKANTDANNLLYGETPCQHIDGSIGGQGW